MPSGKRIYLDTNVFIIALEGKDAAQRNRLAELLALAVDTAGEQRFFTSQITISEVLVSPYRHGQDDLAEHYKRFLFDSPWLSTAPISTDILQSAAILRAGHKSLKLPDAIHLATALEYQCSDFVSADTGIKDIQTTLPGQRTPSSLTVRRLDEASLQSLIKSLTP
ncbi:putative nucleic acid-binding protein [Rhizobium aquaticum]|uniref:Nucleic acid-binding protein n=1 Tax=Rhizobium aquaticum TaxID=1549636 RepID=A0ABV2J1K8_9HYPH